MIDIGLNQNKYHPIRQIGRGAWSRVFLAVGREDSRTYALKVYDPTDEAKEQLRQRNQTLEEVIRNETEDLGPFCPNVVSPEYREDADGRPYAVMPYLSSSLGQVKFPNASPYSIRWCIELYRGVVKGLLQFHTRAKKVHGDINPDNILVQDRNSRLMGSEGIYSKNLKDGYEVPETFLGDLGASSAVASMDWSLDSRSRIGRILTRAPERCHNGSHHTTMSDTYSLAACFLYTLTGKEPFARDFKGMNREEFMRGLTEREAEEMIRKQLDSSISNPPLKKFLAKALAFDPNNRFNDGRAFKRAFFQMEFDSIFSFKSVVY